MLYACMWHVKSVIQDNTDRGDRSQIVKVEIKDEHSKRVSCM